MCVADLCITDYSSLIFEYSIFERPILFYAYDLKEYCKEQGFFYEFESFVPDIYVNGRRYNLSN